MRRFAIFGLPTGGTDGAPLVPIVVPESGAFGPPKPLRTIRLPTHVSVPGLPGVTPGAVLPSDSGPPRPSAGAGQVLIQPGTAAPKPAPIRTIKLPTSAELEAQIAAMAKAGASAAQIRPVAEKLLRAKAREAATGVPGLPGVPPGAVLRDDAGRVQPPATRPAAPGPRPRPPLPVPGMPPPVVVQPAGGPPVVIVPKPASDVAATAGSAVGGRIAKDLLTFALLTSPAWLALLLFPRHA